MNLVFATGMLVLAALILALGVGAVGLLALRRGGRQHPSCGRCGYDVSGTVHTERCPECGTPFVEAGIRPPRGQRGRGVLIVTAVGALIVFSCLGSGLFASLAAVHQAEAARAAAVHARLAAQARRAALEAQLAALAQEALDAEAEADTDTDTDADTDGATDHERSE